jgi:hypothetical protein
VEGNFGRGYGPPRTVMTKEIQEQGEQEQEQQIRTLLV